MEFRTSIFTKYMRSLYKINLNKTNQVHKVLIKSIFQVFIQMEEDINQMRLEICLSTASGQWLDLWGDYFGIPRKSDESDSAYSTRIIAEIIEPKATLSALKRGTARWINANFDEMLTELDVIAYEPWKDLLVTSHRGKVSYLGRLPDSEYWTHGVVDLSIPDSSELSSELIVYLNTIKAAGVQLTWHRQMSWDVLTGYFDSDKVVIWLDKYYDIWIKREYEITDGLRTLSEDYGIDESYNTPISVRGYISGRQLNQFIVDSYRDFEPFRFTNRIVQQSPLIKLEDYADLADKEFSDLTTEELGVLELIQDRQIPNIDNLGKLFEKEIKPYLYTSIGPATEELKDKSISELKSMSIKSLINSFEEDTTGLNRFLENWRKHNYFNKPINSNPLSESTGPLEILTITNE